MDDKKKILIIRFSSIGDIVLCSPIIRCVKSQIPNCELHFVCKHSLKSILENNPHLDKVYSFQKNVSEILDQLSEENYSHVVDLHNNLRSAQILRKLKTESTRLHKANIPKWIMVNLKMNFLPQKHIVDRSFDTVKSLNVHNDMKGLDFYISEKDHLLEIKGKSIPESYIAIVLSGTYATKQIPAEKIISIAEGLQYPIVLIGGEKEKNIAQQIVKKTRKEVIDAVGNLSLGQSAFIIKNSHAVISPDTGMMHIAAAFNKNIISVWGNTIAEFGMYPYIISDKRKQRISEQNIIQVMNLACRPCSKLGKSKCPKGHFKCMNDINVDSIVSIANNFKPK